MLRHFLGALKKIKPKTRKFHMPIFLGFFWQTLKIGKFPPPSEKYSFSPKHFGGGVFFFNPKMLNFYKREYYCAPPENA